MPRAEAVPDAPNTALAHQLNICRRRGLADLDVPPAVETPDLDALAQRYDIATKSSRQIRVAQIRRLLRDSLEAYAKDEANESRIIRGLFFGGPPDNDRSDRRPGELLTDTERALGMAEETFRAYRRKLFARFAHFLVGFVAKSEAVVSPPAPSPLALVEGGNVPPGMVQRRRWPAALASVVIVGTVVGATLVEWHPWKVARKQPVQETEANVNGSPVFADPSHLTASTLPRVRYLQKVLISCKEYDPSIASVSPDGYWYRVASPPWDNLVYTAANTFLNGDELSGPTKHNHDQAVPNC